MKKLIFFILVIYGAYNWYTSKNTSMSGSYGEPHNKIIMYSLTTCGFCKQKVKELHNENIVFTEYFIDEDRKQMNELNAKLSKAGFEPKRYGTPIFDVHGVMLPNNPDISVIKRHLKKVY